MSWNEINWKIIEAKTYNLQNKIYFESKKQNTKKVKFYQKKLINSTEAKLLATRLITQDNRGKKTAGVDNKTFLTGASRLKLAKQLIIDGSCSKIKQVFIKKNNSNKLRPLGIPTIKDRCKQMLVKLVLEPEWEAKFCQNSFGFRPGYSQADAKWAVARQLQQSKKFILKLDIFDCFNQINHDFILQKLNSSKFIKNQIKSWLKAGILNVNSKIITEFNQVGTPQGAILSPLLLNIAFCGFENFLLTKFKRNQIKVIRFADDILITAKSLDFILKAKALTEFFIKKLGLKLNEVKTKICHSFFKKFNFNYGVKFLGFEFFQVKTTKKNATKNTNNKPLDFKLITRPSQNSIREHKHKLKVLLKKYRNANLEIVINRLANQIRGWTNYFNICQATKTFSKLDNWFFKVLWSWAKRRYKTAKNAKMKCFSVNGWSFGFTSNNKTFTLNRHDQTKIKKIVKIKPGSSIFDKNLLDYFAQRCLVINPKVRSFYNVFKQQKFKCYHCNNFLLPDQIVEVHHINNSSKICLVHGHCHDALHSKQNKK